MVKCYKCGRSNKNDKDLKLFTITANVKGSGWQMEFMKRQGIQDIEDQEIHVCSRHFRSEDLVVKDYMWTLKENALPVETDTELEEEVIVRPEVVYLKCNDNSSSGSEDIKELAPLEPLVEYVYEDEEEEVQYETGVNGEVDELEDRFRDHSGANYVEYSAEGSGSQVISLEETEENNEDVESVMPIFLTSSPVFMIPNENNEVGETIILQIDDKEAAKQPPASSDQLSELQNSLCITKPGTVVGEYMCDICNNSYGCLNCLKSHYETLHIAGTLTQYKCKDFSHVSKSTVCPVCDLMFPTRSETMDHYINHAVACDICGSGFDRQAHLTDHYKTAHPRVTHVASYECELCKTGYQYAASLAKHYQTFHRMVLCHVCKLRFVSVHQLQDHEVVHREKLNVLPFACSKCDKAFPRISDIVVHIRADHKKTPVGGDVKQEVDATPSLPAYTCSVCNEAFLEFADVMAHTRDCHKENATKDNSVVEAVKMPRHKKIKVKK